MDQILLGQGPPASDHQGCDARGFRRQLQAPRGCQTQARDLADNSRQSLFTEAFLDEGQDVPVAIGLGIDHTVRMQASAQEARGEQILTGQAPEHGSLEAGSDPGGEQGRAAGEFRGKSCLDHLVQSSPGKPTPRQVAVDLAKSEGQGFDLLGTAFEPGDPMP